MPLMVLIMGAGPLTRWKHQDPAALLRTLRITLVISIAAGILVALPFLSGSISAGIAVALSLWLLTTLLSGLRQRFRNRSGAGGFFKDFASRGGRSYYGMWTAHIGVAFFIIGVTFVTQFDIEKDVRMGPGDSVELAGYLFRFDGARLHKGPNYQSQMGTVHVFKGDKQIAELYPEKRTYQVQTKPMTEAGIDAGFTRDIYVSLGEPLGGGEWALRLYYKPFVRWIWLGGILIAAGGLLAASDPRYRSRLLAKLRAEQAPASPQGAAEGRA
jgi:cytochrome c-type biogenesis protein CcmF